MQWPFSGKRIRLTPDGNGRENWDDDVFNKEASQHLDPLMGELRSMISDSESCVRQIVQLFGELESLASGY